MMKHIANTVGAFFLGLSTMASAVDEEAEFFEVSGADAAAIQGTVDAFRDALGDLNDNVVGSFGAGRREINWDGVPDDFAAPNAFPPNFFNANSPPRARGVVFFTTGTDFQVSADSENSTNAASEFGNLNSAFPGQFTTFSPERLFTAVDSNIVEVLFFEPGLPQSATTTGFGAVFTDVDRADSTKIEYFDANGELLFSRYVIPGPVEQESLSFLGVKFTDAKVFLVRITSGNRPLVKKSDSVVTESDESDGASDPSQFDDVVMDDFIFGEPQPQPQDQPDDS